jgi:hypothetical protein
MRRYIQFVRHSGLVDSFAFGVWELGNGIIQLIEYMIKTGKFNNSMTQPLTEQIKLLRSRK